MISGASSAMPCSTRPRVRRRCSPLHPPVSRAAGPRWSLGRGKRCTPPALPGWIHRFRWGNRSNFSAKRGDWSIKFLGFIGFCGFWWPSEVKAKPIWATWLCRVKETNHLLIWRRDFMRYVQPRGIYRSICSNRIEERMEVCCGTKIIEFWVQKRWIYSCIWQFWRGQSAFKPWI